MTVVTRSARYRWLAVVCAVAVLCGLPVVAAALPVSASPISAAALRTRILASASLPYQGYAESTAELGLPQLPDVQDVTGLLDGTTDQYVWYRSERHWRADTLSAAGEDDVYQICQGTFLWSSAHNLLTRILGAQPVRLPRAPDLLPPTLARTLLRLASPADRLSRLPSLRVAGVDAAGLRLGLASTATTVAAVEVWADPADGLPVEVRVIGRTATAPVLTSAFLQLSQHPPALATVIPHPAPGVDIATARLSSLNGILNFGGGHGKPPFPGQLGGQPLVPTPGGLTGVAIYGTGFARFVLLPLPGRTGTQAVTAASMAGATPIALHDGSGVLIRTPLLTVLLATPVYGPTFLLTGAVTPALLEQAASALFGRFGDRR